MCFKRSFLLLIFGLMVLCGYTQPCPANISFEAGNFNNWVCSTGSVAGDGTVNVNPGAPQPGRHTLLQNSSPQTRDPYGDFPVNCPNGSKYSIMLGNSSGGHQAERVSYTYTIPADKPNFTIVYYYAVVLQTPNHKPYEQPKFEALVTDVSTGTVISGGTPQSYKSDISCANHLFTASAGLQGFKTSKISSGVVYRDWSPVVISLVGYAGHTIQMDFTTNDCVYTAHFGYAYLDFNDICDPAYDGLIVGNKYCQGVNSMTLTAPAGFETYTWYDEGFKNVLGSAHTLTVSPAPPVGTKYALIVTPPPDLGCVDTLYTVAKLIDEVYVLQVKDSVTACSSTGADLTQDSVTVGSSPDMKFEYYTDKDGQNYLSDPKRVTTSGTYYIRGTNAGGCTDIAPIKVALYNGANVKLKIPDPVCQPNTVDLTATVIPVGPGITFTYYSDAALTKPVLNPQKIARSGQYYVAAAKAGVPCLNVSVINIIVDPLPVTKAAVYSSCPPLNLRSVIDADQLASNTFVFYTDSQGLNIVPDDTHITVSGTYYYRAFNAEGCPGNISPIVATVYPVPNFKVTDPAPVVYPQTVNLDYTHIPLTFADFSYWLDKDATKPLENYETVAKSGTYYIKAINSSGCYVINPVNVLINAPEHAGVVANNTFTPNGDGVNDYFVPTFKGLIKLNFLKIYNRNGIEVFDTTHTYNRWDGTIDGKPAPVGTYYWVFNCYDTYYKKVVNLGGSVTIIR